MPKRKKKKYSRPGRPRKNYEFEEAVEVVRRENLRSAGQYDKWWKLHTPSKLPKRPDRAYEREWKGWGYFLGNYNKFPFVRKKFRSYEDAKDFAHSLNLKSVTEWHEFAKSGKKPNDIPSRPDIVYRRNNEWHTWSEFLGNKIELKLKNLKAKVKYFYITQHRDAPPQLFNIGITTSKENLLKDSTIKVIKLFESYDNFDWKLVAEKYGSPYWDMGNSSEYYINDFAGFVSELSLDLFEIPI
jgi:hypothetical protein